VETQRALLVTEGIVEMKRRQLLVGSLGGVALVALSRLARANAEAPKELRIGYQKNGVLVIARQQAVLEKHFAPHGIGVKWVEFTSGPPLLEAMNVGSIDLGPTGDTPPIFAQVAGANIVYVAGNPSPTGRGSWSRPGPISGPSPISRASASVLPRARARTTSS
jgi:sulfonate transport system substrate-binding protein